MDSFLNRRIAALTLIVFAAACTESSKPPSVPETLGGGWNKTGIRAVQPSPLLGSYVPVRVDEASFTGPPPVTITYHRMPADTVAFELMQKWRSEPGVTHFHNGPLFVVIRGEGLESAALNAIAKQAEEALKR